MIAKHGSKERAIEMLRASGSRGGKSSNTGGFAYLKKNNPNKLKEISREGGKNHAKGQNTTQGKEASKSQS